MKNLPNTLMVIMLAAFVSISCKKDQPKEEMPADDMIVTDTAGQPFDTSDTDTVFPADGSNAGATSGNDYRSGAGKSTATQSNVSTSAKNQNNAANAGTQNSPKDKNGKSLKGYSAPDGTDAENNDGDQYTKNDQKRMPSGGTSIK